MVSTFKHTQDRTVRDMALVKSRINNLHKLSLSLSAKHHGILSLEDIEDLHQVQLLLTKMSRRYEFIKE